MSRVLLLFASVVFPWFVLSDNGLIAQEAADKKPAAQENLDIYHDTWIDRNKNGKQDPYENPELSVDERIADLLGRMNIDEKTAQMGTIYGYKRILKDPRPTKKWKTRVWKDGILSLIHI